MPLPRPRRPLAGGLALLVTATLAPVTAAGTVPASDTVPSVTVAQQPQAPEGYPRQIVLREPATDPADAARRPGLTAYDEIAPRLNDLQEVSDRVSVRVIGRSVEGRDLYLVTLTAPESVGAARAQGRMRERILHQPRRAATDQAIAQDYKVPVFVNANIHGDEWEGTDAALELIADYATSTDPAVQQTLARTRISLVVTMNPDGRHDNTRSNAAGFDLNRDFITASQPETRAVRDAIIGVQPMLLLDLHGYVNGTLVEPTTPPHSENVELDLLLQHAYPTALAIEQAISDLGHGSDEGVRAPQIPFRDWAEGWDGWPPIFTPQYAALHGASALTIELPLRTNRSSYDLPVAELRRRSAINTDIALAAATATLGYAVEHRESLIAHQIEWYRRGVTGSDQVPVTRTDIPGAGPEDVYLTQYPRAYVIPTGPGQRSPTAAARLVDHLVDNGVAVTSARRPVTVAGTTYPAGSYVVDLHQAKRGVAGAILGPGTDISRRVRAMYDISGWSHALLWGADVQTVPAGVALPSAGPVITRAQDPGRLQGEGPWLLPMLDPADVAALNDLLAAGVPVTWSPDGAVVIPRSAREAAAGVVRDHGVVLSTVWRIGGEPLEPVTVAAAARPPEVWALEEMGFDVVPVSTERLNDGFDWSGVDTLYLSSGVRWGALDDAAQDELTAYLAGGGGLVAQGTRGAALNDALDLLQATPVTGRGDANGIARVDSSWGPIASGATPETFVYSPLWFTDLGADVEVDQRFADEDVLVSGHWRDEFSGAGGPDDAQGQALVVHGLDPAGVTEGAPVVLFGSEPLFRAHPKGQFALVARALVWSAVPR